LLASCGGLLGLLFAWGGIRLIVSLKSIGLPSTNAISINPVVLGFTLLLAVLTGVLFGIIPALQISRPGVHDELKGGAGSSVTPTRARRLASDSLVVAEVGLSLLLLVAAGLLLKDFLRLRSSDIGVRPQGVWTAAVALPKASYPNNEQQVAFAQQLLARVQALPGVQSAALSDRLPLEGGSNGYVYVRGRTFQPMSGPLVENHEVSADYFKVMGIPLLQGRTFTSTDVAEGLATSARISDLYQQAQEGRSIPPEVGNSILYPVVINQAMVKALWPNQDPLGQLFSFGDQNGPWAQVIGVVGDVKEWGLTHEPVPEEYSILASDRRIFIVVHTALPPATMTGAVRGAVSQIDSSLPLFQIRTMDDVIAEDASGQQFLAALIGLFAGLALLLAAVGIYGVLSYLVTQRTREIGIRISLGASHGQVLSLVLGRGMRLAGIGFVLGGLAALAAGKVLSGVLHGVTPRDPLIFAATLGTLGLVALLACYIPARRAARVNPVVALRCE
ncbi:MAG TPA: FtsX-like permease family protein, partial [Terriglobales bacterium]|nr:FtsX-like permease family protein [Terriglobales bacterium]